MRSNVAGPFCGSGRHSGMTAQPIAPQAQGRNDSGYQQTDIVQQIAVPAVTRRISPDMEEQGNDQKAPIGE